MLCFSIIFVVSCPDQPLLKNKSGESQHSYILFQSGKYHVIYVFTLQRHSPEVLLQSFWNPLSVSQLQGPHMGLPHQPWGHGFSTLSAKTKACHFKWLQLIFFNNCINSQHDNAKGLSHGICLTVLRKPLLFHGALLPIVPLFAQLYFFQQPTLNLCNKRETRGETTAISSYIYQFI